MFNIIMINIFYFFNCNWKIVIELKINITHLVNCGKLINQWKESGKVKSQVAKIDPATTLLITRNFLKQEWYSFHTPSIRHCTSNIYSHYIHPNFNPQQKEEPHTQHTHFIFTTNSLKRTQWPRVSLSLYLRRQRRPLTAPSVV